MLSSTINTSTIKSTGIVISKKVIFFSMVKKDIMKDIVRLLLVCFISLQLAAHHHCSASEQSYSPQQGERIVTVPIFSGETTSYTRDFDGGFITVEVRDTIVFSITVTTGSQFLCNNLLNRIVQNGTPYIITPEGAGEEEIHITWSNLNPCGLIDAGQTATGTLSVFPFSFSITEPFRIYYALGSHGEDYFDITPGISSTTTTSGSPTTSSTTTTITAVTTTTSSLPAPLCLAEEIYGEYAEETALLRLVRDELLSTTPEGQELIRLYYQWNALLARVPGDNAAIREDIKELIDAILPVFEEMVE
jgi:hypothetical protein